MTSFVVNIKLDSKHTFPLKVHNQDTVATVKQQLCHEHDLKPEFIKIIFQGKPLDDTLILEESNLGENSVLHAVLKRRTDSAQSLDASKMPENHNELMSNGLDSEERNHTATCKGPKSESSCLGNDSHLPEFDINFTEPESGHKDYVDPDLTLTKELVSPYKQKYSLYYVYCKSLCNKLCPGRIRVRCSMCKEGTMEITQEPGCWQDVLKPGQISGQCLSENCTGDKAEFYFKCNGHRSNEEPESVVVLQHITANLRHLPCLTCGDVSCPVLTFPCHTTHIMCIDCFIQYCNTRLDERQFVYSTEHGYTLGCPAGCENSLIIDGHHFRLLGEQQYERYQRFATEECLLREGGVMCPAPGCGEGIFPEDTRRIQCVRPECQFVFCQNCRQAYHETGDCDTRNISVDSNNRWFFERRICDPHEDMSLSTIASISKPCPRCKIPVEKSGGCMHMTCSRCSFEWCWLCQMAWSRDCQGSHWFG